MQVDEDLTALTGPWTDYYEAEWDDGASQGSMVALPTVVVAGLPPAPATLKPTYVASDVQSELDDFHDGLIADVEREIVAAFRPHEHLHGKLPTALVDEGWMDGTITSTSQEEAVYGTAMNSWISAITFVRGEHYADLSGITYTKLWEGRTLPLVRLKAKLSAIDAIIATDTFLVLNGPEEYELDVDGHTLRDPLELNADATLDFDGIQSFDGAGFEGSLILYENVPDARNHPGFNDASGNSRVLAYRDCSARPFGLWVCPTTAASVAGHDHATMSLGLLAGDLTGGQMPSVLPGTDTVAQQRRSAFAHEASVYAYREGYLEALDDMIEREKLNQMKPQISSASVSWRPYDCSWSSMAVGADWASMLGVAQFFSAGNPRLTQPQPGDGDVTTCELQRLSMATGTMSVQFHDSARVLDPDPRSGEPGGRSQDLTVYGVHNHTFNAFDGAGWPFNAASGTSVSAPILASAAATYQEMSTSVRGRLVDDPGILYANLLLMGDRYSTDTCPNPGADYCTGPDNGFDSTTGAGRFVLRTFSSSASPSDLGGAGSWKSGRTCIHHGDVKDIEITLPATWPGTPRLDAVARWTNINEEPSRIKVELVRAVDGAKTVISADAGGGTITGTEPVKRRVGADIPAPTGPGVNYYLRIHGTQIDTWDPYCGQNRQRVHFAMKIEE